MSSRNVVRRILKPRSFERVGRVGHDRGASEVWSVLPSSFGTNRFFSSSLMEEL